MKVIKSGNIVIKCPRCKNKIKLLRIGRHSCSKCYKVFWVEEE